MKYLLVLLVLALVHTITAANNDLVVSSVSTKSLKLTSSQAQSGYVLTSDSQGNAQWTAPKNPFHLITESGNLTRMTGDVNVQSTTASTSSVTGSLRTAGGLGVVGDAYVGGTIQAASVSAPSVQINNAAQAGYVLTATDTLGHSHWAPPAAGGALPYRFVDGSVNLTAADSGVILFWTVEFDSVLTLPARAPGLQIKVIINVENDPVYSGSANSQVTDSRILAGVHILKGHVAQSSTGAWVHFSYSSGISLSTNHLDMDLGDNFTFTSDGNLWFVEGTVTTAGSIAVIP